MTEKKPRQKSGDRNYVNNKEFTEALDKYSMACRKAVDNGEQEPRMPNYIGECIMKMAERLATTPRFRGYPFREDMVGNSIVAAVNYAKKFDGNRFNNGFAYITQILFSHMVQTIIKEKQKYHTDLALIQQAQLSVFGLEEMAVEQQAHAQMIADQKLHDMEKSKEPKGKGGFQLRTGYNKEAREKMMFTPVDRSGYEEEL